MTFFVWLDFLMCPTYVWINIWIKTTHQCLYNYRVIRSMLLKNCIPDCHLIVYVFTHLKLDGPIFEFELARVYIRHTNKVVHSLPYLEWNISTYLLSTDWSTSWKNGLLPCPLFFILCPQWQYLYLHNLYEYWGFKIKQIWTISFRNLLFYV